MNRIILLLTCLAFTYQSYAQQLGGPAHKSPASYVNPFIGTRDMGHCYPGASVPFGMVQLSPDTDTVPYSAGNGYNKDVYRYCAGYQYNDPTIVGFSHTHLHGTGHSDLGDFLLMPTAGKLQLNPGTAAYPEKGYRSSYSKTTEKAQAGYYAVELSEPNIRVELTATERTGFHRYTFKGDEPAHLILDMVHGIYNYDGKVIWSSIRVVNDTLITGYRQTNGWARNRFIYFAMVVSKPITHYGIHAEDKEVYKGFWRRWKMDTDFAERSGRKLKAWFDFDLQQGEALMVKMALSSVSASGALQNLLAENPGWNFEGVRRAAFEKWNQQLSRIQIDAPDEQKTIFYTAAYHSALSPILYQDVDGLYRGLDGEIHKAEGFTNYTVFSLWDTFRALHPLVTLMQPSASADMVNSMLAHYDQSPLPLLPIWSHHANDNWCMIGYHAVPVIADAYVKGVKGFDANKALEAMVKSATYEAYDGLGEYMMMGYVPAEASGSSASVTLEYAYDDWTIAAMAQKLGNAEVAKTFDKRSEYYKNLYDPATGFIRAKKKDGRFVTPFESLETHGMGYIEGNAWTYSLFVPQDVPGLIQLMGGPKQFNQHMDSLFTMELPAKFYEGTEDIEAVGLMGNYVHGNEPGHHIPYMYCYSGQPWKTQQTVRKILKTMYHNTPSGLCGNDDCGQMSAWYLFSSLGFYPVCPGSDSYVIGSPAVVNAQVLFEDGRKLEVVASNFSEANVYVQSVKLNGLVLRKPILKHADLVKGGKLEFVMGAKPAKKCFVN